MSLVIFALMGGLSARHRDAAHAATSPTGRGIGVIRLGTSYQLGSGYDRYGYVIVGPGDAGVAGMLPGKSLVYQSGTDVAMGWSTGVPHQTALANGWLLKDASGAYLTNAGFSGMYVGDVGSATYQQAWVSNVSSLLSLNQNDGVFIDDVLGDIAMLTGGKYPAKYPDQPSWENATASFMAYVGPALKARGFYVLVNAHSYISGNSGNDDGSLVARWWQRLGPSVSGFMSENWLQHPLDNTKLRGVGPDWWNNWDGWANLASVAQAMGRDFFGLQYASSTNTRVMTFGKASFLLFWNGEGGAYMFSPEGSGEPWNASWTTDIGTPIGARYQVGSGWRRDYTGGSVLVNPSSSATQTFSLGAPYLTSAGAEVTSVTLTATTAAILRHTVSGSGGSATQAPVNTSPVTISGSNATGQTLTASTGVWSNSPTAYAYGWLRCDTAGGACIALPVTANAYTVTTNDVGHTLRANIIATNEAGSGMATSAPTGMVPAPSATASTFATPINTQRPVISGRAEVAQTLSVSTGSWTPLPSSYLFAWHRCNATADTCSLSPTSTNAPSYTVQSGDIGFRLVAQVAPNGIWSASVNPAPTGVVAAAIANQLPVISGRLKIGARLSTSTGIWSGSPLSFQYQWYRCDATGGACRAIPDAVDSSYLLTSAERGGTLRTSVTASYSAGSATQLSNPVGPVGPAKR